MAAGTVDDGAGGEDFDTVIAQQVDDFAGAAAGGDHVFNNHGGLAGVDFEAAAERHLTGGVALRELETCPQGAGDFVADDQAANRR